MKRGLLLIMACALGLCGCADFRAGTSSAPSTQDPNSAAAAAGVVHLYGLLIQRHRFADARLLWGDPNAAAAFEEVLRQFAEPHVQAGRPGPPDGAAGSIFVTVPAIFFGPGSHGSHLRRAAAVTLRRVNDVPGSTDAQRRWHIERIEWTSGP